MSVLDVAVQLSFWGPILLFCIGVPASFFNAIIFVGVKTFRQSSSAYYVVGQSLFDLGVLLIVLLQSIPSTSIFSSSVSCKAMLFFSQLTVSAAMSFLCLSAFDRWAYTSRSARIRQLSSTHTARRVFPFPLVFWSMVNMPYLIFCDLVPPTYTCWFTNDVFGEIASYFLAPIFCVVLPLIILILFCTLTYRNICVITHVHVQQHFPRTRSSMWEQQMTKMMIIQTVLSVSCVLPRSIFVIYSIATITERPTRSLDRVFIELLIDQLTTLIMCINFVSSFYIFFLSSARFRQTIKIYTKLLFSSRHNQIVPVNISLTATRLNDRQY